MLPEIVSGRGYALALSDRADDQTRGEDVASTNWTQWHDAYARPGSGMADRLAAVGAQIERFLDATAPDPGRVVSACRGAAGAGRGPASRRGAE